MAGLMIGGGLAILEGFGGVGGGDDDEACGGEVFASILEGCDDVGFGGEIVDCVVDEDDVLWLWKGDGTHVGTDGLDAWVEVFAVVEHVGRDIDGSALVVIAEMKEGVASACAEFCDFQVVFGRRCG